MRSKSSQLEIKSNQLEIKSNQVRGTLDGPSAGLYRGTRLTGSLRQNFKSHMSGCVRRRCIKSVVRRISDRTVSAPIIGCHGTTPPVHAWKEMQLRGPLVKKKPRHKEKPSSAGRRLPPQTGATCPRRGHSVDAGDSDAAADADADAH